MTGITRVELERRLNHHLTEEAERIMATTDIQHQHELLQSRLGRNRHRRRPPYRAALAAAATAAAVAVTVVVATRTGGSHEAAPTTPALPTPAGTPLQVYRGVGSSPGSVVRELSFLDTRGRWCVASLDSSTAPTLDSYSCRRAMLPRSGHGFGAVYGNQDAPTYDNFRSWFGGVATPDVKRVTVVFADGRVAAATVRDQGSAHGVVFSLAYPTVSLPSYYRAYDANGHLVQQIPVQPAVIPTG